MEQEKTNITRRKFFEILAGATICSVASAACRESGSTDDITPMNPLPTATKIIPEVKEVLPYGRHIVIQRIQTGSFDSEGTIVAYVAGSGARNYITLEYNPLSEDQADTLFLTGQNSDGNALGEGLVVYYKVKESIAELRNANNQSEIIDGNIPVYSYDAVNGYTKLGTQE